MAIAHVNPGQNLTATTLNSVIDGVNATALQGIVPSSVAGTSVTVSAGGAVSFTAANPVSMNGVFSGTYANYRVVFNITSQSAASALNFRFRQAGTDVSTATYGWLMQRTSGTTTQPPTTATAATSGPLSLSTAASASTDGFFDVFGPASGSYTAVMGSTFTWASSVPYMHQIAFQNSTSASMDGFTVYPSSGGTFAGVFRVYGYNNLT